MIKYGPAAALDLMIVTACYLIAVGVRTGGTLNTPESVTAVVGTILAAGVFQVLLNLAASVYWRDWSVAALEDLVALVQATLGVGVGIFAMETVTDFHPIPLTSLVAACALSIVAQAAIKLRPRWPEILRAALGRGHAANRVIVVGAGRMGQLLARDLAYGSRGYRIACFVDDDPRRHGSHIRGVRVAGSIDDLPALIMEHQPAVVVIAVANPPGELVRRVLDGCNDSDVVVRAVAGFEISGPHTAPLRAISIDEFLEREPVELDRPETRAYLSGKRVLVTGAAGSIGSELSRQVARLSPQTVVLLDLNESGLHDVRSQLAPVIDARIALGDIRNRTWLRSMMLRERPDVVFHAAAYKHVPILEEDPIPALEVNVVGLANVLEAARSSGVERFVFVSSDKAVEPVNVLGYTKRFGELLTIAYAQTHGHRYAVVRFGNVLGSAGSVVPTFTRQLDEGGPLTVTDPEATRFFMTISEAAGLVIEAGAIATEGDLLVLDMGRPMSIADLARKMLRLRGLPSNEVSIKFTGLRPGERLHEQLYQSSETPVGTGHPRVMRVKRGTAPPDLPSLLAVVTRIRELIGDLDATAGLRALRAATDAPETSAVRRDVTAGQ